MRMNPEIKAQWIAALRSGEYEQGRNELRTCQGEFCCLGVVTDLAVKDENSEFRWVERGAESSPYLTPFAGDLRLNRHYLSNAVGDWMGIDYRHGFGDSGNIETGYHGRYGGQLRFSLAELNDEGFTFDQIADVIEYFL